MTRSFFAIVFRQAEECLARLAALLHAVPPGADADHAIVVALDHLHRLALTVLGRLDAEEARLLLLLRRHPAERPGAEAGDVAAGLERIAGGLGAVENLQPIAAGI